MLENLGKFVLQADTDDNEQQQSIAEDIANAKYMEN